MSILYRNYLDYFMLNENMIQFIVVIAFHLWERGILFLKKPRGLPSQLMAHHHEQGSMLFFSQEFRWTFLYFRV